MGRQQYLTRLALGRSAFEDEVEEKDPPSPLSAEIEEMFRDADLQSGIYHQQYDNKGRPINPAIEQFNAEMRAAQNEALELVGVVERKDHSDRLNEVRRKYVSERRTALLAEEHDRGELLDFVLTPIRFLSRQWLEVFVHRIQIGFYDSSLSMSSILLSEWRNLFTGGFTASLATRFPAMGDILAHTFIRIPLTIGVEQLTGRLQTLVQARRLPRRTAKSLYQTISVTFEVLLLAIDVALLPIEYHAFAQRLGLAPPLPLFPSLKFILPFNPLSFHTFGWTPLAGFTLIRTLTSPAFLLLIYKIFHFDDDDDEVPICALFTSYRYPKINETQATLKFTSDPIGYILQTGWRIRTKILQFFGWNIVKDTSHYAVESYENNTSTPLQQRPLHGPTYRSTHLAHMPALHLAKAIDKLYSRILILPLESLMLRTIAATYLSSPYTPKTSFAISASTHIFWPFGGGPIATAFRSTMAWQSLGIYLSRLGLSLALSTSLDTLLCFGTYTLTRHIGLTYYDWGTKARNIGISGIVFGRLHNAPP